MTLAIIINFLRGGGGVNPAGHEPALEQDSQRLFQSPASQAEARVLLTLPSTPSCGYMCYVLHMP